MVNKGGLTAAYSAITNYQSYLKDLIDKPDKTGKRDLDILQSMMTSYQTILQNAAGTTRSNFQRNLKQLSEYSQAAGQYQEKNKKQQTFKKDGFITLHDLVSTLCEKTLDTFQKITRVEKLRFVYGLFHDEVGKSQGKFSNQPIADFPIDLAVFKEKISEYVKSAGTEVLTVEGLFTILISDFLHDDGYWKKLESTSDGVRLPQVYLAVNNYVVNGKRQMDISLVDINRDVPITSRIIEDMVRSGKSSVADFERAIKDKAKNIPIVKLGHSNSFIRELKLNNVMDEYLKAVLIKRMADSSSTYSRSFTPAGLQNALNGADTKTPLSLPLQGSMTVLGSVDWKPFRSFGLISNIFVVDAIYSIMSVEHTINPGGFSTTLTILYH